MRPKKVICIETGKEYEAIADVKKDFPGVTSQAIKTHRLCNGYHWKYSCDEVNLQDLKCADIEKKMNHYRHKCTQIININSARIYNSVSEAEKDLRVSRYYIYKAINNHELLNGFELRFFGREDIDRIISGSG